MANRLQFRRGTAAQAVIDNPVLADGELGVETDTKKVKMGDGSTAWNSLQHLSLEINWLGELTTAPLSPTRNDAYRDLILLESRIWDGSAWDTLVIDGVAGGPVPVGGTADQIIVKNSATDFDVVWTDGFGVGDIIMHDGVWTDNVTKVGWYACIAANAGQGCPDLENSFIKGSAPADVGDTGGANTHTLLEAELPGHTHDLNHDHGAATTGSHHHKSAPPAYNYSGGQLLWGYETTTAKNTVANNNAANTVYPKTESKSVSVNLPALGTVQSGSGTGGGDAHNNEPQYYKLIYIRKCS